MSQFQIGQTVFDKHTHAMYEVLAERKGVYWLWDVSDCIQRSKNGDELMADFAKSAEPQKCPFCGGKAELMECPPNKPFVRCLKETFWGPHRDTSEEAIAAWNSIEVVSLQNPRRTKVEWVEKIDAEFNPSLIEHLAKRAFEAALIENGNVPSEHPWERQTKAVHRSWRLVTRAILDGFLSKQVAPPHDSSPEGQPSASR